MLHALLRRREVVPVPFAQTLFRGALVLRSCPATSIPTPINPMMIVLGSGTAGAVYVPVSPYSDCNA